MSSKVANHHSHTTPGFSLKAAVLCTSIGLIAGCGGGGGGGGATSTGSTTGQTTGSPGIAVSPTSLDFGKVVVGQTTKRNVTITSNGTLDLDDVQLTSPVEGFSASGPCATVAMGTTCDITVEFTPVEQKAYTGSFSIDSNAAPVTVSVAGEGQGYNVEISSIENLCAAPVATVQVTVSDASNNPVTSLTSPHFTPTLDSAPATPNSFAALTEDVPISVALTVDWSASLTGVRTTLAETAGIFIDTLSDEDTAAIYRFATTIDGNAQPFLAADADGKTTLKDALYLEYIGDLNSTSLWTAAQTALDATIEETNPNRAIVLITDGDNNTDADSVLADLIASAQAEDINVFTLAFGNIISAPLETLAQETGGLFFETPGAEGLVDIYESIVASLTNRYQFTIDLPNPSAESVLTVVVEDDLGNIGEDTRTIAACP